MIGKSAKIFGRVTAVLIVLLAVACGLFMLRLSQGPVSLNFLASYVEDALSDRDGRFRVDVGDLLLSWEDEEGGGGLTRLDLRATGVRAINAEGSELAAAPEMGVGLSVKALFRGRLSPTRLELVEPRVEVIRRADGRVAFDIRSRTGAPVREEEGTAVIDDLLDTLLQPPDMDRQLGLLNRLSIVGADLTVVNRMLGISWHANPADIVLTRSAEGIAGRMRLALDLGGRSAGLEAGALFRQRDRTTFLTTRFDRLEPAALARIGPMLAPLGTVAIPISGSLRVELDPRFQPRQIGFDLRGHAGTLSHPELRPEPLEVSDLGLQGSFDVAAKRLAFDRLALRIGQPGTEGTMSLSGGGTLTEDPYGRLEGSAHLSLTAGGRDATLEIDGKRDEHKITDVTARLAELEPALLADLVSDLAPLGAAALPLSGSLQLRLDKNWQLQAGRIDMNAGAGRVVQPDLFPEPVEIASAALRAAGDRTTGLFTLDELALDLGGPRLAATARATETEGRLALEATAEAYELPVEDLRRYWPLAADGGAREWVTEKLTKGIARSATATLAASLPLNDPAALELTAFDAAFRAEGVTVDYFHPLPVATGVNADVTTDGKSMTIRTQGGAVQDVAVGEGTIVLSDLDTDQERIDIQLPVRGPVRTILTVLDSPPLGYPSRLDIDPKRTGGSAEAQLHFTFPLVQDLDVEDIALDVTGRLHGAAVEDVAAGLDVSDGDLSLALDSKSMSVKGKAKLDGIPVAVDWKEQFVDGKGPRTRVAIKGDVGAEDLRSHGIDLGDYVLGPMGADVLFTVDQRGRLGLTAGLDLKKTRLAIPLLGWEKPPGTPGTGKLALEFRKDRVARVTGLTVDAGGLKGEATLDMTASGTALSKVKLHHLTLGDTDLEADLTVMEGGGYAGTITGRSLDGRHLFGGKQGEPVRDEEPIPLDLSLRLGHVVFGEGRQLTDLVGTIRRDLTAWTAFDVNARVGENNSLSARYGRGAEGRYDAAITATDMGATLRALDVYDQMRGGTLRINGRTVEPRPDAPIEGDVDLVNYTLIDPPTLARLLNATAPTGFAELMGGGKGINFGRLVGNYRKDGPLLTLRNIRTSGSALGITLEGEVDIPTNTGNLRGTIVPVYGLNRLIGQIPLLGDLLSGGEGQGIFSATWHARGPLGNLDISVNPLAVLAPGFLRNLFFLGDGNGPTDINPQAEGGGR